MHSVSQLFERKNMTKVIKAALFAASFSLASGVAAEERWAAAALSPSGFGVSFAPTKGSAKRNAESDCRKMSSKTLEDQRLCGQTTAAKRDYIYLEVCFIRIGAHNVPLRTPKYSDTSISNARKAARAQTTRVAQKAEAPGGSGPYSHFISCVGLGISKKSSSFKHFGS